MNETTDNPVSKNPGAKNWKLENWTAYTEPNLKTTGTPLVFPVNSNFSIPENREAKPGSNLKTEGYPPPFSG